MRKKKKSKTKSLEVIFRYLVKSVECFGLPSLTCNPDPSRRRGAFINFVEKLKLVLITIKQTRKTLSLVNDVKEPKTHSAKIALFRMDMCPWIPLALIASNTSQYWQGRWSCSITITARSVCGHLRHRYQVYALNNFKTVMLKTNETVFNFNKRFGLLYRDVVSSCIFLPERDRIQYYLRALRQLKGTQILFDVKALTREFQSGSERSLREIQQLLIKEEDRVRKQLLLGSSHENEVYHQGCFQNFVWRPWFSYSMPICMDSQAAIQMNESDNPTRKTRHIESRYWYGRLQRERALVAFVMVDGKHEQPADPGTKITPSDRSAYIRRPLWGTILHEVKQRKDPTKCYVFNWNALFNYELYSNWFWRAMNSHSLVNLTFIQLISRTHREEECCW